MRKILIIIICTLIFTSCSTRKEIVYFQDIEKLEDFAAIEQFEPKIEVNDVLRVNVFSNNQEVAQPFNLSMNRGGTGGGSMGGSSGIGGSGGGNNNAILDGYLVDVDGNIQFPVLGKVSVKGKTRGELEEYLNTELKEYIKDVVVQVRIVNFKVTVLGEVRNEGVVQVPDERVSIPEIIAMSGGISYNGKRENILVIRDDNGKKTHGWVDITEADVFQNPYYFLKQNDIVYVEPTYRQVKSAGFITSYTGIISLVSTVLSLILIFTR